MKKQANLDSLCKVWETKALVKMNRSDEAKRILDKIAITVEAVMIRRKWKVPILKEFYPQQNGLLGMNVNRGQSILIRLRPHYNKDEFYPWEHCIGTMIHELTHMEIGPHDDRFYKLMDEIADEVDNDQVSSYSSNKKQTSSSSILTGSGHILGGKSLISESNSRIKTSQVVAEATLARLNRSKLTLGSGQTLGGHSRSGGVSGIGREVLTKEEVRERASRAAQRRVCDDKSCQHAEAAVNRSGRRLPQSPIKASFSSSTSINSSSGANNGMVLLTGQVEHPSVGDEFWICDLCENMQSLDTLCCTFCSSLQSDSALTNGLDPTSSQTLPTTSSASSSFGATAKLPMDIMDLTEEEDGGVGDEGYCQPCGDTVKATAPTPLFSSCTMSSATAAAAPSLVNGRDPSIADTMMVIDLEDEHALPAVSHSLKPSTTGGRPNAMLTHQPVPQNAYTHVRNTTTYNINLSHTVPSYTPPPSSHWPCTACTYLNDPAHIHCQICQNPKNKGHNYDPSDMSKMPRIQLHCRNCTYMNDFPVLEQMQYNCILCGYKLVA